MDVWDTVLQGFGVRVSPSGRKVWSVIVRPNGTVRRIKVGTYPAVSLAQAREAAGKIIADVQLGVFGRSTGVPTLGEIIPVFIELYAKPKTRGWKDTQRLLEAFQALSTTQLDLIKRSDVVRVLDALVASGKPYTANRALAALKKLMNWALDRGTLTVNPIAGLKPPVKERSRDRVLTDDELRDLIIAADAEGYPFGDMFKMLALTAQRRNEVSHMRWSEIDFGRRVWTIPAARSKNDQSHEVPLSDAALEVLRSVPRFLGSDYVFTTTGSTPISGYGRAKDRLENKMKTAAWRTHDLRRTAASGMARLGVPPHVVEKVLNHRSGIISGVAAVYNRYGYESEKRDALEKWSAYLRDHTNAPSNSGQQPFARRTCRQDSY